jgi:LacI family transcriptional regulator
MAERGRTARLRDVAEAAGVSVAAVSRYLNGTLHLPPATAARIDRAIRTLDYRPNPHARRLSRGRSDVIGLVLPDIANPFFAHLAASVEEAADAAGLELTLAATLNRPEREHLYLERMRRNHVDGLIFITNHGDDGTLARIINQTQGVVLVDEDVRGAHGPKVFCDNEQGGWLAARHLLEAGHRDLACIAGPADMMSGELRLAGFRRAVQEAGPPARILAVLPGPYSAAHGRAAAAALLDIRPRPTAIFVASDEIVLGVLPVLRAAGLPVPEAISVIGFDDIAPLDLFDPPLTTIRQPVAAMGHRAVEFLCAPQTDAFGEASVLRLPAELVVRQSVAPPARALPGALHGQRSLITNKGRLS